MLRSRRHRRGLPAEPSAATLVRSPCSPRSAAGRASPREWPLLWLDDGDRYLVVAPDAGRDRDPAWLLDLRADPVAVLQVGADRLRVRAHVATETEARTLWPRPDAMYDGYADYRSRTDRPIRS